MCVWKPRSICADSKNPTVLTVGVRHVVFAQAYPWQMSEQEKALTENNVREVFEKYIKILTDEPVKVDYWIIENGG